MKADETMSEDQLAVREDARRRSQRRRSIAIALGLVAFAVFFYLLTIVRMGPALFERTL